MLFFVILLLSVYCDADYEFSTCECYWSSEIQKNETDPPLMVVDSISIDNEFPVPGDEFTVTFTGELTRALVGDELEDAKVDVIIRFKDSNVLSDPLITTSYGFCEQIKEGDCEESGDTVFDVTETVVDGVFTDTWYTLYVQLIEEEGEICHGCIYFDQFIASEDSSANSIFYISLLLLISILFL